MAQPWLAGPPPPSPHASECSFEGGEDEEPQQEPPEDEEGGFARAVCGGGQSDGGPVCEDCEASSRCVAVCAFAELSAVTSPLIPACGTQLRLPPAEHFRRAHLPRLLAEAAVRSLRSCCSFFANRAPPPPLLEP